MKGAVSVAESIVSAGRLPAPAERPVVCVQGLGFVGMAMALAVAAARDREDRPCFDVVGVDLPTPEGREKIEALNNGRLPFFCSDEKLHRALARSRAAGNLSATEDPGVYRSASVTLVDVNLDLVVVDRRPTVDFSGFEEGVRTLGRQMPAGSLIIVETTVPPGTCEKVVRPELTSALRERGMPPESLLLAYSYERVMPGAEYFDSIVNYWRVYAGCTSVAADACESFLSKVINVEAYPLTRLSSTTAAELGKVIENSYRAVNIAFMDEWSRFAEAIGVDLYEVVSAVRQRPTHVNIREPGFGVGGYCLPKDPLLGSIAARELHGLDGLEFPFSQLGVATNSRMPLAALGILRETLQGTLRGKKILLLGVSYRPDVADTRNSPSLTFYEAAKAEGADVICHDPWLRYWPETDIPLPARIPSAADADAVVLAVRHQQYMELDVGTWIRGATPVVLDANNVLADRQRKALRSLGCRLVCLGRGAE